MTELSPCQHRQTDQESSQRTTFLKNYWPKGPEGGVEIIDENTNYRLEYEHMTHVAFEGGKHWLTLVEKKTGEGQVLAFRTKREAIAFVRGVALSDLVRLLGAMGMPKEKMYKEAV